MFLESLLIDFNVLILMAAFKSILVNNLLGTDIYLEKRHLHERFFNDSASCYR